MRNLLLTLLVVGLVMGIGAAGSNAIFTSSAANNANTFNTATISISTSPASAFITYSAMVPGDVVTQPLTVTNSGTAQLRYAVTSTTTEDILAAQLDLTIKSGVTTCTNAGFSASGAVLYGPGDLGSAAGVNVMGDPAQGSNAGDRTLNPAASEVLCFQVSLPLASGNAYQGLTSTATFTFNGEQTANNP